MLARHLAFWLLVSLATMGALAVRRSPRDPLPGARAERGAANPPIGLDPVDAPPERPAASPPRQPAREAPKVSGDGAPASRPPPPAAPAEGAAPSRSRPTPPRPSLPSTEGSSAVRLWLERLPDEATVEQFRAFLDRTGAMVLEVDVLPGPDGETRTTGGVLLAAGRSGPQALSAVALRALVASMPRRLMIRTTAVSSGQDVIGALLAPRAGLPPPGARRERWLVLGQADSDALVSRLEEATPAGEAVLRWDHGVDGRLEVQLRSEPARSDSHVAEPTGRTE